MNQEEKIKRRQALRKVRGIVPYLETLTSMAQYHKTGEHIDIFEIGVQRGPSTRALLRGLINRKLGTGHLYSVDITDREYAVTDEEQKKLWTFIMGDSTKIDWDKPIDILFIDGNHRYKGVKADYEKYEPFVKSGGYILMHDVTSKGRSFGVHKFWPEIKYSKIILQYNSMGLGVIQKP